MDRVQMVNSRNILIASLLLLSLGTMPAYADGAGIEEETPDQELLALCFTPEATLKAVETLLKAGADVNAIDKDGRTPLMLAAHPDTTIEISVIKRLLIVGHVLDSQLEGYRFPEFNTALMEHASHHSNPAIIEILLEAGANAKAKNKAGKTAIDYAKENEKIYKTKAYWKLNDALYE